MKNVNDNKEQPVCKIDKYGTKRWILNENFHREDGPAVEYSDGDKHWFLNGKWIFWKYSKYNKYNKFWFKFKNYSKQNIHFIFRNVYLLNKETK